MRLRHGLLICAALVGCNDCNGGVAAVDGFAPDLLDASVGDLLQPYPDSLAADLSMPDLSTPDLLMPDFSMPDLLTPDLLTPDLLMPDLLMPDLLMPDLLTPDLLAPPDLAPSCPMTAQSWHVAPTGSDTTGTGSAGAPFKTITHAIAAASSGDAVLIHGTASYGAGCTGGAPCDALPIQIATTGVRLIGDGTATVTVTGPGTRVFDITAACVTLSQLTVTPTTVALSGAGGDGIVISAPTGAPGTISGVTVNGVTATMTAAGTGIGIAVYGGAPTLGPGLKVTGGFDGIDVSGATPTIVGTTAAPTVVSDSGTMCLRAFTSGGFTVTGGTVGDVTITRCSLAGAQLMPSGASAYGIDHALFTNTGSGLANTLGIIALNSASLTISSSTVSGFTRSGIEVDGSAKLNVTGGLAVSSNGGDGILCSGTANVKLRGASMQSNGGNGFYAFSSCTVDLGSVSDPGSNDYGNASSANALSGVCLELNTGGIVISDSSFACGRVAAGCGNGTPVLQLAGACVAGADLTLGLGTGALVYHPTCCR